MMELENVHFDAQSVDVLKYINFTFQSYNYYAVITKNQVTNKWEIHSVCHEDHKEKECPLCNKAEWITKSKACSWFDDKFGELFESMYNHSSFRMKALFELGSKQR